MIQPDGSADVGPVPSSAAVELAHSVPAQQFPERGANWKVTFVTYNCLSLQSLAQRDCLEQQFQRCTAHVIGLQETPARL